MEDPLDRIQRRLVDVTDGHTGRIWITTEAEMIGAGLEEQLTCFLKDHPDVNFVLIDTLQKIRDMKSEQYSYAGDYRTMTAIKAIADRFGIAILLIHHTRKQPSTDPFDMISGTTGLMGCADSSFVLLKNERLSDCADFYGTGRDIEFLHLNLRFSGERMCWELIGSNLENEEPPKHDRILRLIRDFAEEKEEWRGTATELLAELKSRSLDLELSPNVLVRIINANMPMLRNFYKVAYSTLPRRDNTKRFSLRILRDVVLEDCPASDVYANDDLPDICGHTAPIEPIAPQQYAG